MSKKVVDTPIYVDTYKLVGIVYGLRFSIPKRDRAVLGDRLLDTATAMLVEFTLSYKLRGILRKSMNGSGRGMCNGKLRVCFRR